MNSPTGNTNGDNSQSGQQGPDITVARVIIPLEYDTSKITRQLEELEARVAKLRTLGAMLNIDSPRASAPAQQSGGLDEILPLAKLNALEGRMIDIETILMNIRDLLRAQNNGTG